MISRLLQQEQVKVRKETRYGRIRGIFNVLNERETMRYYARRLSIFVALALLLPVLAACSGDDEDQQVTIGWIPWDEDIAVTYLWANLLEDEGYDVELELLDAGQVFLGLDNGDIDVFLDTWLPGTHADYWADYGADLEDLGVWYDNALLAYAVPDYVDVQTIPELADNVDLFGGQIIGIEPGAGMMGIAMETVNPGYGLDDFTLVESSTPAMLAELDTAVADQEPIVVTMWQPHWAYDAYNLRNLEDPDNLWGDPEQIHAVGRDGFTEDFPDLAEWFGNFQMGDDALFSLEAMIIDAGDGNEAEAVEEWLAIDENRELAEGWITD